MQGLIHRWIPLVRKVAEARYDEGYDRGVHDHDATAILATLLRLHTDAGPLRYPPHLRAAAQLFWAYGTDDRTRALWTTRARSLARARSVFGPAPGWGALAEEIEAAAVGFMGETGLYGPAGAPGACTTDDASVSVPDPALLSGLGDHLMGELAEPADADPSAAARPRFATSAAARDLLAGFRQALGGPDAPALQEFAADLRALDGDLAARHQLVTAWLGAYTEARGTAPDALPEATAIEVCGPALDRRDLSAATAADVPGLLGSHPRITAGAPFPYGWTSC